MINCTRCGQTHENGDCPNDRPIVAPTVKVETPAPGLWAKLKAIATGETP